MTLTANAIDLIQFARSGGPLSVTPNASQFRFMWLHARHVVIKWHWQFQGAQLRAFTDKGMTATISAVDLQGLVDAGLALRGVGCADVLLTDAGMELAK